MWQYISNTAKTHCMLNKVQDWGSPYTSDLLVIVYHSPLLPSVNLVDCLPMLNDNTNKYWPTVETWESPTETSRRHCIWSYFERKKFHFIWFCERGRITYSQCIIRQQVKCLTKAKINSFRIMKFFKLQIYVFNARLSLSSRLISVLLPVKFYI